jgi:uridine kinase
MSFAPYLVGIAGGSGSGKTSLIRALRERLPPGTVSVVSQDDYYLPSEHQAVDMNGRINFDLPEGIDLDALASDLEGLRSGRPIQRREYTFNNSAKRAGWKRTIPAPLVLVEGLFVLHHERLRNGFDLRVFVHAENDVELHRRLRRDAEERGYGREEVLYQWQHHVLPAHARYLLPHRLHCEVEVDNGGDFEIALASLRRHLDPRAPVLRAMAAAQSV